MAQLSGAETLFVNGAAFVGDPERRSFRGVPIALKPGTNDLFVFGIRGTFELQLWSPPTRTVIADWDLHWSDGFSLTEDLCAVFNASTQPVEMLHVHFGHAIVEDSALKPRVSAWSDAGAMLPLGLRVEGNFVEEDPGRSPDLTNPALVMPICVYAEGDSAPDQRLLRRPGANEMAAMAVPSRDPRTSMRGTLLEELHAPCVFVVGSEETTARARFDQQVLWYRTRIVPEPVVDREWIRLREQSAKAIPWKLREPLERGPVVVYGNADTNKTWSRILPADFPPEGLEFEIRNSFLFINGKTFETDDICGWMAFRKPNGSLQTIAIADTGTRGARLGYLVQPLFAKSEGLDYCFWDSRGENGAPRVIASGTFAKPKEDASRR